MPVQLAALHATLARSRPGLAVRPPRVGEAGQSMVEYAITLALIAVAAMVAVQALGGGIAGVFTRILGHISGIG